MNDVKDVGVMVSDEACQFGQRSWKSLKAVQNERSFLFGIDLLNDAIEEMDIDVSTTDDQNNFLA
jgi:hypothetical protein